MSAKTFFIVSLLFWVSGISSLVYQVIWTRSLVLVFGSTQFATATVLSVFMAGLGLGAFFAGKVSRRLSQNSLLWYGILEGLIGAWSLLTPVLFSLSVPIYQWGFQAFHLNPVLFAILRFTVASIILLPPTTCMGATLPLLSSFVANQVETIGKRIGTLYALNTFGAVCGALLGGFVFLPYFGLSSSTFIAAALNLLLFVFACLLSKKHKVAALKDELQSTPQSESSLKISNDAKAVMAAFFVSGALAMFYEIGWTRILLMLIGSTTYAFTVMLSTFLLGIFLGSLVCARFVDRLKNPTSLFAVGQIYLCFALLLSLSIYNFLPYINLQVVHLIGKNEALSMLLRFGAASTVLLPITLCLGALFPLAVRICSRSLNNVGDSVGQLYAINTFGAILGAFAAGFLAIPLFGCENTLVYAALTNMVVGVILLFYFRTLKTSINALAALGLILLIIWTSNKPAIINKDILVFAQYEKREIVIAGTSRIPTWTEWLALLNRNISFFKDGICANVAISKMLNPPVTLLFTNGHCDASDRADMENQVNLALLPLLLNPGAKDVCVVGWGSGVTAAYSLKFPLRNAICAEIEPAVLTASKFFHHVNFSAETDKRCHVEPSDGRNFLLCSSRVFDVIISEPSNPWQVGVCNLFTKEYFQITKQHLAKNGLFAMWCQLNEVSPKNLKQIISALHEVYPTVYLFDSGQGDLCAVASAQPFKINVEHLKRAFEQNPNSELFGRFGTGNFAEFLSRLTVAPPGVHNGTLNSSQNTDDLNYLEFDVAKSYENKSFHLDDEAWLQSIALDLADSLDFGNLPESEKSQLMLEVGLATVKRNATRGLYWLAKSYKTHSNMPALSALIEMNILAENWLKVKDLFREADNHYTGEPRFLNLKAMQELTRGNFPAARSYLNAALVRDSSKALYKYRLAQTYSSLYCASPGQSIFEPPDSDPSLVLKLLNDVILDKEFVKSHPDTILFLADAEIQLDRPAEAIDLLKSWRNSLSKSPRFWRLLARAHGLQKNWEKFSFCLSRSAELGQAEATKLFSNSAQFWKTGDRAQALLCLKRLFEIIPDDEDSLKLLRSYAEQDETARELLNVQLKKGT